MHMRHAAVVARLALGLMSSAAHAAPVIFNYTGGFQTFIAQAAGIYNITAFGAQGGTAYGVTQTGGLGAQIGGDFSLTAGESLTILVGGMGGYAGPGNGIATPPAGGGGRGSYVYTTLVGPYIRQPFPQNIYPIPGIGYVPLAIAGGGGGTGYAGRPNNVDIGGQSNRGPQGNAGVAGNGADSTGGSGAGFHADGSGSAGAGHDPHNGGQGGVIPVNVIFNGPSADGHGGFGGGGASGQSVTGGFGGGGGGYNGGNGGILSNGGGGFSFLADGTPMNADYVALSSVREGDGLVTINFVSGVSPVPLPASAPMFGAALLALGAVGYGLKRKKAAAAA